MIRFGIVFLLFIKFISANQLYLDCDNAIQQQEYFEQERIAFGIEADVKPFDFTGIGIHNVTYYPATCRTNSNELRYVGVNTNLDNIFQFAIHSSSHPRNIPTKSSKPTIINRIGKKITDSIFWYAGFTQVIFNGEYFWYYQHPTSNNTVFYLHGISYTNGVENLHMLSKLKNHSNVFVSIFSPAFTTDFSYNHTVSQHIINLNDFINQQSGTKSLVGNSYGSLRTSVLCRRYPETCDQFNHIVLTDPLTINTPFSAIQKLLVNCVLFDNSKQSYCSNNALLVKTLKREKIITFIQNNFDWIDATIDTHFMNRFSKSLTLVIGTQDGSIQVNQTSYAMTELCRVIYTNTRHGMVLFTNVLDQIDM